MRDLTLTFMILLLLTMAYGCNTSLGVGMGTGTTRVGVGMGGGGTSVGVGAYSGSAVTLTAYKDFLNNGPNAIYTSNKQGVTALNNGDYDTAANIFENNLQQFPNHPDSTYYLGLTRIYQGDREAGFALLRTYRDPDNYRMTSEVQRSANMLEPKTDLTPKKIHEVMNKNRYDGYQREMRERMDMRPSQW